MGFFKSKVVKLSAKSAKIKSVFSDTVDQLVLVNSKIEAEKAKKIDTIVKAQQEHADLESTLHANGKLILKITEFLSN